MLENNPSLGATLTTFVILTYEHERQNEPEWQKGQRSLSRKVTVWKEIHKETGPIGKAPFTRYNRLSNPLSIRLYNPVWLPVERTAVRSTRLSNHNRLYRVYKHSTGCQTVFVKPVVQPGLTTGSTNRFDNRLNEQRLFVQHGCQTGCQTHLTTSWMFVYTIQPVVVWQPVVSCKRGLISEPVLFI